MPLVLSSNIAIPDEELDFSAIRAQGSGGQNVNKVSSAIHLRFDVAGSSLPDIYKTRLLSMNDKRITKEGVIVIKAQQFRTQEKNRQDALDRLKALITEAMVVKRARIATRPKVSAKKRRVDNKTQRGKIKALRGPVRDG